MNCRWFRFDLKFSRTGHRVRFVKKFRTRMGTQRQNRTTGPWRFLTFDGQIPTKCVSLVVVSWLIQGRFSGLWSPENML